MPGPSQPIPAPALALFPLNETFTPKVIALVGRVKIGRQTSAKTMPNERNGYFDTKVLSRQHAEVWEEDGKIWIKDVKSSNGTFVNQIRLSQEGVESEPFELHTDDIVEFGIDIVGEDNKTIIHHKVASRCTCILSHDDAQSFAAHHPNANFSAQNQPAPQPPQQVSCSLEAHALLTIAQFNSLGPRRPGPDLSGLGANPRPPTHRSGPSFDHIFARLQNELAKSRETAAELGQVSGAMGEIQDTLGTSLP
ncbi:SMAD/FHA domain-containing protein, partial [Exidia glandulosa HHB12029]